ncbi:hypothetical protein [Natronococcus sp.]|uniref:hypothetical protein n=1 Tax=Natronococcus sp. TaxID=35747 RepID=UPI003A4E4E8E
MKRRRLLAGAGVALLLPLSGCLSNSVDPKDHPPIPDPLTRETVVNFVEAYETAETHNRLRDTSSADSITVSCAAVFNREANAAYYVITLCGATLSNEPLIGSASVGHYETYAPTYRVDEQRVQRIEVERDVQEGADHIVRLFNFDDADHEPSLTITPLADSKEDQILASEYALASETAVERRVDLTVGTEYELAVELNNADQSETFNWDVHDQSRGVGIYFTPEGTIELGPLPRDPPVT